jgi:hypothetical protein
MIAPVKRINQIITSKFGPRWGRMHRGIDLRTRNFLNWKLQKIVCTEHSQILRMGTDGKGNDFIVVKPLESDYTEIKYIHVTIKTKKKINDILFEGEYIGKSQIKGSSTAHHLHFETVKNGQWLDPLIYFDKYKIKYKFKK